MDFKQFMEEATKRLQEKLGGGYTLEERTTDGLNSTTRHSLVIDRKQGRILPCINMDDFYKKCQLGLDMDAEIDRIVQHCREEAPLTEEDVAGLARWELVKPHIFGRLVNTEKNTVFLQKVPHRPFLDLSLVYCVRMEMGDAGKRGFVQIDNKKMSCWGVNEETLYTEAEGNLKSPDEAVVKNISEVLSEISDFDNTGCPVEGTLPMYILGNRRNLFGAAQMLNKEFLRKTAESFGDDFWLLPSSVHEALLLPCGAYDGGAQRLAQMVESVNQSLLNPDEVLSNHIYRYDRAMGKVNIAI